MEENPPTLGVSDPVFGGKVYLPPLPPFRPGPPATKVWNQYINNSAISILGPYFVPDGPNPATGASRPLWMKFSSLFDLSGWFEPIYL